MSWKAYINQAKQYNLYQYYDTMTGCYFIPMEEYTNDRTLQLRISELLFSGECFDQDGVVTYDEKMALELFECTEDGIEMGCHGNCETCTNKRMISIRPVKVWS